MPYDATKMQDWQIAEAAEERMPTPDQWRKKLGLKKGKAVYAVVKASNVMIATD